MMQRSVLFRSLFLFASLREILLFSITLLGQATMGLDNVGEAVDLGERARQL